MLKEQLKLIGSLDKNAMEKAKSHLNSIAKPLYSLGIFEDYIVKIAGITGEIPPKKLKKCVAVMCADNGVTDENVTQTGSYVTGVVAYNITQKKASVTNMASVANADVFTYDVGMNSEVFGVINKKVARGTKNFAKVAAMTREEAEIIIENGIEIVSQLKQEGYNIIASGEMGIGNTTTSSAVISVLLDVVPELVTGRGAGLSKEGVTHKAQVIYDAIKLHSPNKNDPIDVLSKVGGFDIAAMCGLFLGGAIHHIPIIIDGYISSVAALVAAIILPCCKDYMLPSHTSAEPAAQLVLNALEFNAPLHCNMALGEGTGAVSIMPLLDMAYEVYFNMPTFDETEIEEYKPL